MDDGSVVKCLYDSLLSKRAVAVERQTSPQQAEKGAGGWERANLERQLSIVRQFVSLHTQLAARVDPREALALTRQMLVGQTILHEGLDEIASRTIDQVEEAYRIDLCG